MVYMHFIKRLIAGLVLSTFIFIGSVYFGGEVKFSFFLAIGVFLLIFFMTDTMINKGLDEWAKQRKKEERIRRESKASEEGKIKAQEEHKRLIKQQQTNPSGLGFSGFFGNPFSRKKKK